MFGSGCLRWLGSARALAVVEDVVHAAGGGEGVVFERLHYTN